MNLPGRALSTLKEVRRMLGDQHADLASRIDVRLDGWEEDGGLGSGNWGHSSVKGKRGGSAPGPKDGAAKYFRGEFKKGLGYNSAAKTRRSSKIVSHPDTKKVCKEYHSKATKSEKGISKTVRAAVKEGTGKVAGWKYRKKSEESYERKFNESLEDRASYITWKNKPKELREYVGDHIYDGVRYTNVSTNKRFASDYQSVVKGLEDSGCKVKQVKNTMKSRNAPYKGVTTVVEDQGGQKFEMQFHTRSSLKAREQTTQLYKKATDRSISRSEAAQARKQMIEVSKKVKAPENIESIKSFNTLH